MPRAVPGVVLGSFWILIASAGLRIVVVAITAVSWKSITRTELHPLPAHTTVAQATQAIHTQLTANVILDVIFAGLYVLFAFLVKQGRNWARMTLMVVIVVFGLFDILGGTNVFTLVTVLVELVAVGLLYMPPARAYFTPADRQA